MIKKFLDNLYIESGSFLWILVLDFFVDEISSQGSIYRIIKNSKNTIKNSFSGNLVECRNFQIKNGGLYDGILLLDGVCPIKIIHQKEYESDFSGFKKEDFAFVNSLCESFCVQALQNKISTLHFEIQKIGFSIISHVPKIFIESELFEKETAIYKKLENDILKIWVTNEGELLNYYSIQHNISNNFEKELTHYAKENYFNKNEKIIIKDANFDNKSLAKTLAHDAWIFKTKKLPSYPIDWSIQNQKAKKRIKNAEFFKRILKTCTLFLTISAIILLIFSTTITIYSSKSKNQIQNFEKKIQTHKEIENIINELQQNNSKIEVFLQHKSKIATTLNEISNESSKNLWFSNWNIQKNKHKIEGYGLSTNEVSNFLTKLENNPKFINIQLHTTEKTTYKRTPVIKFNITAEALP